MGCCVVCGDLFMCSISVIIMMCCLCFGWFVVFFVVVIVVSIWMFWLMMIVGGGGWVNVIGGIYGSLEFLYGFGLG